jgi:hypothetical protein
VAAVAACVSLTAAASTRQPVIERFLAREDQGPMQYRALRRLDASNLHFGASAWMDVWTDADVGGGFRYQVASQGGSSYIRRKVFLAALDGEQKMWREGEPQRAQLNLTNYLIQDEGVSDGLASLAITPRRKDVLLIDGWVFVKQDDGDLVRIEGHLSKVPSLWTRHVEIIRRYNRIEGVHVPTEIESVAQVLIAGRSTFRMTYEYQSINGQKVGDPQPRATEKRQ